MVKSHLLIAIAAIAAGEPIQPRQFLPSSDIDVLQLALAFEHLESALYEQALHTFSADDFRAAGYSDILLENIQFINRDESTQVRFWEYVIQLNGATPVAPCNYSLSFHDIPSFLGFANVMEGVSISNYLGAAYSMSSQPYVLATGSLLATEAVHTSLMRSAAGKFASSAPFGTPLDPSSVHTFISNYTTSCPSTNAAVPWTIYEPLAIVRTTSCNATRKEQSSRRARWWDPIHFTSYWLEDYETAQASTNADHTRDLPKQGDIVTLSADDIPSGSFVTFASDIDIVSVPARPENGETSVEIPIKSMGQTYIFLTSVNNTGKMLSTNIVAGPAILEVAPLPTDIPINVEQ